MQKNLCVDAYHDRLSLVNMYSSLVNVKLCQWPILIHVTDYVQSKTFVFLTIIVSGSSNCTSSLA